MACSGASSRPPTRAFAQGRRRRAARAADPVSAISRSGSALGDGRRVRGPAGLLERAARRLDLAPLELPADRPRPLHSSFAGATIAFGLPDALAEKLRRPRAAGQRHAVHGAGGRACRRCSTATPAATSLAIGFPAANRNRSEIEGLIGLFVNSLPLHVRLADGHDLPHAAGARARSDAGRARAPGPAVRTARRGAAARAQPQHQPALPGHVRPAHRPGRRHRRGAGPAATARTSRPHAAGHRQGRPERCRWRTTARTWAASVAVQHRPVRRGDDAALHRALPRPCSRRWPRHPTRRWRTCR